MGVGIGPSQGAAVSPLHTEEGPPPAFESSPGQHHKKQVEISLLWSSSSGDCADQVYEVPRWRLPPSIVSCQGMWG